MGAYRSAAGVASGDREPTLPLRRVPPTGKMVGVMTSHAVHELWCHWHKGHTVGCTRPDDPDVPYEKGMCAGCDAHCALKYEAYVGFYCPPTKAHVILALPVGAVRQIIDQLGAINGVRGIQLAVARAKPAINSRVTAQTGMQWTDRTGLPAPFDVISHLQRIWGVELRQSLLDARKPSLSSDAEAPRSVEPAFQLQRKPHQVNPGDVRPDDLDGQTQFPQ